MTTETPKRPAVRYHGGKWRLAPWIIDNLPPHRVYVEPFGGGASVMLRKPRSYAEVYNDLDGEIVNLFRVIRDHGSELIDALRLTPFARDEFERCWHPSDNSIEQARRTVARSFMGFGSAAITLARCPTDPGRGGLKNTGFRSNSNRSGSTPAHDWANYPQALLAVIERFQGVVIENRTATRVIADHDAPETLIYADPPYLPESRDRGQDYRYEMTENDHIDLSQQLRSVEGLVVLSGYPSALYERLYHDWLRVDRRAFADGASERVECLWLNPRAAEHQRQCDLFGASV
ncbi:DNA adenine methylase [Carnimonas bestiolae]|uniref:DNA adenine methylase n=1 Tax=Carnimonas bestiolae TaxID=3402172 RepID=UPI003EDBACF2